MKTKELITGNMIPHKEWVKIATIATNKLLSWRQIALAYGANKNSLVNYYYQHIDDIRMWHKELCQKT